MAGKANEVGSLTYLAEKMRGHVTCFEGVDGAGKTTMAKWLQTELLQCVNPDDIVMVREPGGTDIGESIRSLLLHGKKPADHAAGREPTRIHPMTETLLFFAARAELYDAVIRPALAAKKIVLADRCLYSTVAYQCYGLSPERQYEFSMDHVLEIAELTLPKISDAPIHKPHTDTPRETIIVLPCSRPSCTIVLDIDSGTRRGRMDKTLDNIESRGWEFFDRVRNGYLDIATKVPNVLLANGGADQDTVRREVIDLLSRFYVSSF